MYPASWFRLARRAAMTAAIAAALAAPASASAPPSLIIQRLLVGSEPAVTVAGLTLEAAALRGLYGPGAYTPLWTASQRDALIAALENAGAHALDKRAYRLESLRELRGAAGREAELDVLLTATALRYLGDLRHGRVDPAGAGHDWQLRRPAFDAAALLREVLGGDDLERLDAMAPAYGAYGRLAGLLADYRAIRDAGGWGTVPTGATLRPGDRDPRVLHLRRRLAAGGDWNGGDTEDPAVYDAPLVAAVRRFQERHGLEVDGLVGRNTLAAMNVAVEARMGQIAANMERWRWMPRSLERRHVAVNIAAQRLEAVEDGKVALATRVVVGKPANKTPIFRAAISKVTLNPPWRVPYSIADKEILPALWRDPGYLIANRMKIVGAFPEGSPESDGIGIDWRRFANFPYSVRQLPGPGNALGRLKFEMPNGHDIYLHDTPSRHLFETARRAYSHGCVRVQDPLRLAALLLGKPEFTPETLQEMIDAGATRTVAVDRPAPVYLLYFTAWIDESGVAQFRDDIYGYDKALIEALGRSRQPGLPAGS